jgi:hypothetical protein
LSAVWFGLLQATLIASSTENANTPIRAFIGPPFFVA